MEHIQLLAVALGLAGLAGINLYLTVFVTGLSVQQGWITLLPQYSSLEVLSNPVIIGVAGLLFLLEFFADKIPWVDSLWDSVHTVIRPIGGALLAIQVLGDSNEVFTVIVALLSGGTALLTHAVKASTRLVVNASPEPFSNIAVSVVEDAGVLGFLAFFYASPIIAFCVLVALLALAVYMLPRLFRVARVQLWLVLQKLRAPVATAPDAGAGEPLPNRLPGDLETLFAHHTVLAEKPEWALRCIASGGPGLSPGTFGYLIATAEEPTKLHFVAKTWFSQIARTLDLDGYLAERESKLLCHHLVLAVDGRKKTRFRFAFPSGDGALVLRAVQAINARIARAEAPPAGPIRIDQLTKPKPETAGV